MCNTSPVNNDWMSELIQNTLINQELLNSQEPSRQGPDSRSTLRQLFLKTDRQEEREKEFEIIPWWKLFRSFVLCSFEKQWASLSQRSDRMVSNLHASRYTHTQHTHTHTAGNSLRGCKLKLFSTELLISSRAKISTHKCSVWGQDLFTIKEFPLNIEIWKEKNSQ